MELVSLIVLSWFINLLIGVLSRHYAGHRRSGETFLVLLIEQLQQIKTSYICLRGLQRLAIVL